MFQKIKIRVLLSPCNTHVELTFIQGILHLRRGVLVLNIEETVGASRRIGVQLSSVVIVDNHGSSLAIIGVPLSSVPQNEGLYFALSFHFCEALLQN